MPLRLLVCSDTHGKVPPRPGPDVDAVLHAGDLYNLLTRNRHLFDDNDVTGIRDWLENWQKPVCVVRGNHDCGDPASLFKGRVRDVGGRIERLADGLFVAGVGWNGRSYYDLPGERELAAVCRAVLDDASARNITPESRVLLVTHYPYLAPCLMKPGERSRCESYDAVRSLIEELRPRAVIQGHHHSFAGRTGTHPMHGRDVFFAFPGPSGGILEIDESGALTYAPLRQ